MRSIVIAAAAVSSAVAVLGFAGAARASATIDLIWSANGTNEISRAELSSNATLRVILTAGPNGSTGAGVSVDYSTALRSLVVLGYASTPGGPLPIPLGSTTDTGTRIANVNSFALAPSVGTGLAAGQSHQLGTITFFAASSIFGSPEIWPDTNGPTDVVLDLAGNDVTAATTFNSAFLYDHFDPWFCILAIEINALRGGSPTVTANTTKNITAKARIAKWMIERDTTIDTTLRIDAVDGQEVIDTQISGPIRLEVGKGGKGDTLTMNITQCNSGSIDFVATFFGTDVNGTLCEATRRIARTCK
jgi:hypothetical protein